MTIASSVVVVTGNARSNDQTDGRWSIPQAMLFMTASSLALWLAIGWTCRLLLGW